MKKINWCNIFDHTCTDIDDVFYYLQSDESAKLVRSINIYTHGRIRLN